MNSPSAVAPNQLLGRLDASAFTARHLALYVLLLAGHFLDGFVINVTGVVLPGVIKGFHLTSGRPASSRPCCSAACWSARPSPGWCPTGWAASTR